MNRVSDSGYRWQMTNDEQFATMIIYVAENKIQSVACEKLSRTFMTRLEITIRKRSDYTRRSGSDGFQTNRLLPSEIFNYEL